MQKAKNLLLVEGTLLRWETLYIEPIRSARKVGNEGGKEGQPELRDLLILESQDGKSGSDGNDPNVFRACPPVTSAPSFSSPWKQLHLNRSIG
jgi:hypothetical protein